MLAIAVGAVLAAGAMSLFERATTRAREQRFVQQVTALAQGMRSLYDNGGAPPYGPAGSSVDVTSRLFDLGLGTSDSRAAAGFVSAYGRALTVTVDGAYFTVTTQIPADACAAAWQKMPGLYGLQINGGTDLFAPFDAATQSAIVTACSASGALQVAYCFQ